MPTKRTTQKLDFDKVWLMFQETDRKFQETKELLAKSSLETDRKFQETKELLAKSSLETDRKFQETKELLAKSSLEIERQFQETDKKFQETDKKFQETDRQMKNLMKKMSESESRWGKFVESLVEGNLVELLNQRGIEVQRTLMRAKSNYNNKQYEFDIIAKDGDQVVVVEVKTSLSIDDVNHFVKKMQVFKKIFTEYSTNQIIGAVAFINSESESHQYAAKKGFFVIKATSKSAKIINEKSFKPKLW